jgi:hypothetical protein
VPFARFSWSRGYRLKAFETAVLWRKRHKQIETVPAYFGGMPRAEIRSKQAIFTLSQPNWPASSRKTGTLASKSNGHDADRRRPANAPAQL